MRIFNTLQRADIQVLSLVASHGREHQICIRAGIDHVDICSSTIEISSIESIIEPVYTPLILVSHPPHDGRQARECRDRSEEHTSELQSPDHLVCRLLLEKKKIELPRHTRACTDASPR